MLGEVVGKECRIAVRAPLGEPLPCFGRSLWVNSPDLDQPGEEAIGVWGEGVENGGHVILAGVDGAL